jgi:dihydrofolate synthase/folylpolyglutamate synthase
MIFGAMKDKDVAEIAEILFPVAKTLILTRPNNERSMELDDLEVIADRCVDKANVIKSLTVEEALEKAKALSGKKKIILVTGSLYLVGEAKKILRKQSKI